MTTFISKSWMGRGIALLLAIVFTMTPLSGSLPQALASVEVPSVGAGVQDAKGLRKDLYVLPAELGSLVSSWEPPAGTSSQGLVVHIQDAHANPEAQRNISGILQFLAQKYPGLAIGVEGVAGPLHPEYLQFFKEFPEANQAVVNDLLQKGELGGAELFLLQEAQKRPQTADDRPRIEGSEVSAVVSGLEDIDLYRESLKTYRELLFKRDEMKVQLTPLRAQLDAQASRGLNADLLDFLKERKRRKEGKYDPDRMASDPDLQAYMGSLNKQAARVLRIDLKDRLEQLRFPNLVRVLRATEAQKSFDIAKAREDWKDVLTAMKKNAPAVSGQDLVGELEQWGQAKGLVLASKDGAAIQPIGGEALYPRKLLERLFLFSKKHSFPLADHGSFLRSFELCVLQAEVEATGLLEEMGMLEEMLLGKLVKTEAEEEMVSRLNSFDLVEKLLSLELTREEYSRSAHESKAMASLVKDSSELKNALSRAYYFYDTTLLRDRVLVENAMALGKGHGGKEKKVTVLITGGFHTDGIDAILRERQIGYVTLMPHISRTDRGERYQKVMAEDHADLSAYFKVKNPFATKQEALLFREMIEVATPVLTEKYQMEPASVVAAVTQAVQAHPVLSSAVAVDASGQDGKALRFVPRTLTPKNTAIASPAITGAVSFFYALVHGGSKAGVASSNVMFGRHPVSAGAIARSEIRENRQPLAKPIKKILLVDDEESITMSTKWLLEPGGFEVVTASSGGEALEILKAFTPDVIISDVRMPGMTGYQWIAEAVKDPEMAQIPILFMSGDLGGKTDFDRESVELAKQHPVHFLQKPFNAGGFEEIFAAPEEHFEHWPATRSEVRENRQPLAKPIQKILVVDDEPLLRDLAKTILGRAGYEVVTADSGAGALEILNTWTPDIVLTDISMPPGMTGPEMVQKFSEIPELAEIPVIFLTGADHVEALQQVKPVLGTVSRVHLLTKPFSPSVLKPLLKDPHLNFEYWPEARSEVRENRQPLAKPIEKILLVDDSPMILKMTNVMLSRKGFEVVTADSGAQALEKLKTFTPDAILSDVEMPGMTGPEWVLSMSKMPGLEEVPIVFMSGYSEEQAEIGLAIEALSQRHPTHFLQKPFAQNVLNALFAEPEAHFKYWPEARSEVREDKSYAETQPRRVLVVDDDAVNRTLISAVLGEEGLVVQTADSGEAAIKKLETWTPDVVLTDVQMPGMTGYEWARKMSVMAGASIIPRTLGTIPIVFMSADVGDPDRFQKAVAELAERHDISFLEKPFDLDDLLTLIQPTQDRDEVTLPVRSEVREGRIPLAKPIEKILVVDDEPSVMVMTGIALTRKGFEVVTANSGAQALEKLKTVTPDAILTDVLMPGMTGPEWVLQMPQTPGLGEIPIVFMSGFTGGTQPELDRVVEALSQRRPVHFLEKPFSVDFLGTLFAEPEANFKYWPEARSEVREEAQQSRAFDALRARLVKQDGKFLGEMGRMNLSAVRTKMSGIWKPKAIYRDLMDLFSQWGKIQVTVLRDEAVNPKRIQELKTSVDGIFASFEKQRYKGSRTDEKTLTPLRNVLEKWAMGYYKPTAFREKDDVSNEALRKYLRKETDAWLVGMLRFIELTPHYHKGFLNVVQTFPESVWKWSRQPLTLSIEGPKNPKYILSILNRWHKFERLPKGELVDRYPSDKISADRIGAARRRQIFLFAEGLTLMIKTAEQLKPSQLTLPFETEPSPKKRSELRGATAEIQKLLMRDLQQGVFEPAKTLVPEADIPQIVLAAETLGGLYSERSIALVTQDAAKARLWIAAQLVKTLSAGVEKGRISDRALSDLISSIATALPANVRTPAESPRLHMNLEEIQPLQWTMEDLSDSFRIVFGALVSVNGHLLLNIRGSEGDAAELQKRFVEAATRRGVELADGQIVVKAMTGSDPFVTLQDPAFDHETLLASSKKALVSRKGVRSLWLLEGPDSGDLQKTAVQIATVLFASRDERLDRLSIHSPSQYQTLISALTTALEAMRSTAASA